MNRGVPQLQRLYVLYNPASGSSKGVVEFVKSPLLQQFKDKHPHVTVETVTSKKSFPLVEAVYKNEALQSLSLRYATNPQAVLSHFQQLADQTGRKMAGLRKWPLSKTKTESLQGRWDSAFNLKSQEEQLKPLQQTSTHLLGLAPEIDAAPAAAAAAKPSKSA